MNAYYTFRIEGNNVTIDNLKLELSYGTGSNHSSGIQIMGNNIDIKHIEVIADIISTWPESDQLNAVHIGQFDINYTDQKYSAVRHKNIKIGTIKVLNYNRPIRISNIENITIENINCENYVRAVYIKDCKNWRIKSGYVHGTYSTVDGSPGENGLLIDSSKEDMSTQNGYVYNFVVENSGEHGFRVGGQKIVKDTWFVNCIARRPGRGTTENHGGCGFKALGPTTVYGAKHEGVFFVNCVSEDGRAGAAWNFAGFQIGKCYNVHIDNCTVRSSIRTHDQNKNFQKNKKRPALFGLLSILTSRAGENHGYFNF